MHTTRHVRLARFPLVASAVLAAASLASGGCGDDSGGAGGAGGGSTTTDGSGAGGPSTSGSGGAGGSGPLACPGTVVGTWEVDGVAKESSAVTGVFLVGVWNFNLVACDGSDDVLQFQSLATPVEPTTFELANQPPPSNDEPGAIYITEDDVYYTDADHGGQLVITDVDPDAMTFTGTFDFTAVQVTADGPTDVTIAITSGVLTDVPFDIVEE